MSRGDYFINRFCYDLAKNMAKQDMIIQKQIEKKKMELEEAESKAFEEFHGYPKYVENYKNRIKKRCYDIYNTFVTWKFCDIYCYICR